MATIFTNSSWTDDSGNEGVSVRNVFAITGNAQDQVRVSFRAASAATFKTDHASIGLSTGTLSNTTATPVELLFAGGHGFTVSNGGTVTSDWVNLSGFTSSDKLVVIYDINAVAGSGANAQNINSTGNTVFFQAASSSYNLAVAGFASSHVDLDSGIALIETQTVGALLNLTGQACM